MLCNWVRVRLILTNYQVVHVVTLEAEVLGMYTEMGKYKSGINVK